MRRVVGITGAVAAFAVVVAATGIQGSSAAWSDREWDRGAAGALDCAAPGLGESTATGRLVSGTLLGIDLDTVVAVHGVTVANDGALATPAPASADLVLGSGGEAYQDALTVSALQALQLETGNLLALPLNTDLGAYGQYARADRMAGSAGAAGLVTDSGGIDLGPFTEPEDERPEFASLRLGALLEEALGAPLATTVASGVADLSLDVGAVAGAAALDGCAADWSSDVYGSLARDYAIAGLDLGVGSPLVGGLVSALDGVLAGVETSVAALASDTGLLNSLVGGVVGALGTVLEGIGVQAATVTLGLTLDLSAARTLLTGTIGDDAGVVAIDLAHGLIEVDIAALLGEVYGTDGLNGLPPNTQLLVNGPVLSALEDAVTDAVAGLVADLIAAVERALDLVHVTAIVRLPLLGLGEYALGVLTLGVDASLASLLDGSATVSVNLERTSGLCAIIVVGAILCGLVNGVLLLLTDVVLRGVAMAIGGVVAGALDTLGAGLDATLDAALDAPLASILNLLGATLSGLLGPDGLLSIIVNAQNDPDPAALGAGPEPPSWAGIPGTPGGEPLDTGRYDVAALLVTVVGALDAVELALARASVGGNVVH